ncbi:hypothetical protein CHU98_g9186 [Xylaria longipes]|nr:hypothetical protein CHU98_g9186 [Xylaria longipes]
MASPWDQTIVEAIANAPTITATQPHPIGTQPLSALQLTNIVQPKQSGQLSYPTQDIILNHTRLGATVKKRKRYFQDSYERAQQSASIYLAKRDLPHQAQNNPTAVVSYQKDVPTPTTEHAMDRKQFMNPNDKAAVALRNKYPIRSIELFRILCSAKGVTLCYTDRRSNHTHSRTHSYLRNRWRLATIEPSARA